MDKRIAENIERQRSKPEVPAGHVRVLVLDAAGQPVVDTVAERFGLLLAVNGGVSHGGNLTPMEATFGAEMISMAVQDNLRAQKSQAARQRIVRAAAVPNLRLT